jgi:hypothetical protein
VTGPSPVTMAHDLMLRATPTINPQEAASAS